MHLEIVLLALIAIVVVVLSLIWQYGQSLKKHAQQQAIVDEHLQRYQRTLGASEQLQSRTEALLDRHEALISRAERLLQQWEDGSPPNR